MEMPEIPAEKRQAYKAFLATKFAKTTQSLNCYTEKFNLNNLESALDHVDDAIDDLVEDSDISSALSEARAAKSILKKAIGSYDSPEPSPRPRSRSVGVGVGVGYSSETHSFNLKHSNSALDHINNAIGALEGGNVGPALTALRAAERALNAAIDSYDNDYDDDYDYDYDYDGDSRVVVSPPPLGPGMSSSEIVALAITKLTASVDLKGETEEFASCSAARKRVRKARRSLRSALRAVSRCSGPDYDDRRVVVVSPPQDAPPPPPPAP